MQLSPNFTAYELYKSETADRLGIDNKPSLVIMGNLAQVAGNVLERVRTHYNRPVKVNSGYRCLEVNRAIGSKDSSQHTQGYAVDFEVPGIDNHDLAIWCRDNLDFDQLILEFYNPGTPDSGWCHISYTGANHRKSVLTINKNGTKTGIL
jgi:zinc D-Ala-D-Ala carboxypeptidase